MIEYVFMKVLFSEGWEDYELVDSGGGKRLERFGKYLLVRPDPQIIWRQKKENSLWEKADAAFIQNGDKGNWDNGGGVPDKWLLKYKNLSFYCKLSPFKHTGVFPEQSLNWDFIGEKLSAFGKGANILNLFGYTGISTLAAAAVGARVTHLDASKPSISWARENQNASGLLDKQIRWILDDAIKFVGREIKRNVRYDGIIMDPPSYGHGPDGEVWEFNRSFPKMMGMVKQLLSDNPLFVIVNAYAISSSSIMLDNVLKDYLSDLGGNFEYGELALAEKDGGRLLSTGILGRWFR